MPSNLVIVQFPRKIKARAVDVDKETSTPAKHGMGGMKLPMLGSHGKHHDKEQAKQGDNGGLASPPSMQRGEGMERRQTVRIALDVPSSPEFGLESRVDPRGAGKDNGQAKASVAADEAQDMQAAPGKHSQDSGDAEEIDIEGQARAAVNELKQAGLLTGPPTFHATCGVMGDVGISMSLLFTCDAEHAHLVLDKMESVGIGSECGSVNILPLEVSRSKYLASRAAAAEKGKEHHDDDGTSKGGKHAKLRGNMSPEEKAEEKARKKAADEKFRAIATQIRVEQVTEGVREGTKWSFDYIMFLVIASAIAGAGLGTDNSVTLVASMLVSPIMGPVLAFTFGTNIVDWPLARQGFRVEALSLCICIAMGFVTAAVSLPFLERGDWPNAQMKSRGEVGGLLVGVAVAIPSGMGVALSLLSKNTSGLVGVAISASLLPPAVNSGMCWAAAALLKITGYESITGTDWVELGYISLLLTIVNIICIYLAGVAMFWVKNVVPVRVQSSSWSGRLIINRKFQKEMEELRREEGHSIAEQVQHTLLHAARAHADAATYTAIPTTTGWSSSAHARAGSTGGFRFRGGGGVEGVGVGRSVGLGARSADSPLHVGAGGGMSHRPTLERFAKTLRFDSLIHSHATVGDIEEGWHDDSAPTA